MSPESLSHSCVFSLNLKKGYRRWDVGKNSQHRFCIKKINRYNIHENASRWNMLYMQLKLIPIKFYQKWKIWFVWINFVLKWQLRANCHSNQVSLSSRAITPAKINGAEPNDNMHNKSSYWSLMWSFIKIGPGVQEKRSGQASSIKIWTKKTKGP